MDLIPFAIIGAASLQAVACASKLMKRESLSAHSVLESTASAQEQPAAASAAEHTWFDVLLLVVGTSLFVICVILVGKCCQAWRKQRAERNAEARKGRRKALGGGGALAYSPPVLPQEVSDDELRRLARLEALQRFSDANSQSELSTHMHSEGGIW